MNINATLLVQAANFFIAYLLFRFILLKPAFSQITQDRDYLGSLGNVIKGDESRLKEKSAEQSRQWNLSFAYFKRYQPHLIDKQQLFKGIVPARVVPPLSDDESLKLAQETAYDLAKRMGSR